jgi:hypothetical protein
MAFLSGVTFLTSSHCKLHPNTEGRDLTARQSRQWCGISLDADDDFGLPPFPTVHALADKEIGFIKCWLDHYLAKGKVVGYLTEFREQLERERELLVVDGAPADGGAPAAAARLVDGMRLGNP